MRANKHPHYLLQSAGTSSEAASIKAQEKTRMKKPQHCDTCLKSFIFREDFEKHFREKHGKPLYECDICEIFLSSQATYADHVEKHRRGEVPECERCNKVFTDQLELEDHVRMKHSFTTEYVCEVCDKRFDKLQKKRAHKAQIHGDGDHVCDVCEQGFNTEGILKTHKKTEHSMESVLECDQCDLVCASQAELNTHMRENHPDAIYKCDKCPKKIWRSAKALKMHKELHAKPPAVCHTCGKEFLSTAGFKNHVKAKHGDTKEFKCEVCGKVCLSASNMANHKRIHETKLIDCTVCGQKLRPRKVQYHMTKMHSDPVTCEYCNTEFGYKLLLRNHISRVHPEKMGLVRTRDWTCNVCGKAFFMKDHLAQHMFIHTGVRRFQCTECDKSFTYSHHLKLHMKNHHGHILPPGSGGRKKKKRVVDPGSEDWDPGFERSSARRTRSSRTHTAAGNSTAASCNNAAGRNNTASRNSTATRNSAAHPPSTGTSTHDSGVLTIPEVSRGHFPPQQGAVGSAVPQHSWVYPTLGAYYQNFKSEPGNWGQLY